MVIVVVGIAALALVILVLNSAPKIILKVAVHLIPGSSSRRHLIVLVVISLIGEVFTAATMIGPMGTSLISTATSSVVLIIAVFIFLLLIASTLRVMRLVVASAPVVVATAMMGLVLAVGTATYHSAALVHALVVAASAIGPRVHSAAVLSIIKFPSAASTAFW